MTGKIIVTITPPTPNGDLHLGHLSGPFLGADVFARRMKQLGFDVLLVSYSDDYQSYLPRKTKPLLRDPLEYAQLIRNTMLLSMESVEIRLDYFMQSSLHPEFAESARHYLELVRDQIDVQERKTFYCESCDCYGYEGFGRGICNWCGTPSDASQCEHCARMPDINAMAAMTCMSCQEAMSPVTTVQHVWQIGQNYKAILEAHAEIPKRPCLEKYLNDALANSDETWGITRPGDAGLQLKELENKPLHTWFMGLTGYRSAVKSFLKEEPQRGTFEQWWHPDTQLVHFLGYDCSYSHAIGYVAQQLKDNTGPSVGQFITNRFLKLDGNDFSTSRGFAVWIKDITAQYPADAVRLYTALHAPETEVANFSMDHFKQWYRSFFTMLVKRLRHNWGTEDINTTEFDAIYKQWKIHSSMDDFSIAGMAQCLTTFSEQILSKGETVNRHHWLLWATMAESICPVLTQEIKRKEKNFESINLPKQTLSTVT